MENLKNSVRLTGFAGKDPEFKTYGAGKKMAKVSLGISEFTRNNAGESKPTTQWFTLVFWNKKVDLIENIIAKGSRFSVEGKLNNNSYTNASGEKKFTTEIVVNTLEIIG